MPLLSSDNAIDYGIEAIWIAATEGPKKIPHRLVRHASVEYLYHYGTQTAFFNTVHDALPPFSCSWVFDYCLTPWLVRLLIGLGLDCAVDTFLGHDDQEEEHELAYV